MVRPPGSFDSTLTTIARFVLAGVAALTTLGAIAHLIRLPHLLERATYDLARGQVVVSVHIAYAVYVLIASPAALILLTRAWQRLSVRWLAAFLVFAGFSLNTFAWHSLLSGALDEFSMLAHRTTIVAAGIGLGAVLRCVVVFAQENSGAAPPSYATPGVGWATERFRIVTSHPAAALIWATLVAVVFNLGLLPFVAATAVVAVVFTAATMLLHLRFAYMSANGEQRRNLLWVLAAVSAGGAVIVLDLALVALEALTGVALPFPAWDVWLLVIGLLIGLLLLLAAVFYHGALDPGLIVRRSVWIALAGPLAVFAFAGIEEMITSLITSRLQLDSRWGSWLAAGLVAVAVALLRPRLTGLLRKS